MRYLTILAATTCAICIPALARAQDAAAVPGQTQVEIDPTRLAAARLVVEQVFPKGTYARMMNGPMDQMMDGLMGQMENMPLRELAATIGLPEKDIKNLGPGTLKEMMTVMDPAFEQRQKVMMHTMMGEMGTMMTSLEPSMQDGLTRAYAKHFSPDQLAELNRFFSTPAGKVYASDSLLLFMDPEVMTKMQAFMPELMKQMPAMIKKIEAATAGLPKQKTFADLTPADRKKLADLLGMPVSKLANRRTH